MHAPIGYCGTVGELKSKIANLPDDAKLYISGSDYGNDADLLLEDYTPILSS